VSLARSSSSVSFALGHITPTTYMEIKIDDAEFDRRQRTLMYAIIRYTKDHLESANLTREQVQSLSGEIAFTIATILDGSMVMHQRSSGKRLQPILTFADDEEFRTLIADSSGNSYMHDYVFEIISRVFEQKPA
jgi:hypothetical protein